MTCPTPEQLAEERIDRVLTQYRESPKLLFLLRTYMKTVAKVALQVCDLPEKFDLDTAVGDQLTIIGKRLGWPRCHCVCDSQPVFGFDCPDEISLRPVTGFGRRLEPNTFGFCEPNAGFNELFITNWDGCEVDTSANDDCAEQSNWEICSTGLSELCLEDDEVYRNFLKVRRYQALGQFDLLSLEESIRIFFGDQAAVLHAGQGRVVIAPGRELNNAEVAMLQLYPRVLPVALGIEVRFHFGETRVFGFGEGWGGLCDVDATCYNSTNKVFGFCEEGIGGFCELLDEPNINLVTENDEEISTVGGVELVVDKTHDDSVWARAVGSDWMCEVDIRPYDC